VVKWENMMKIRSFLLVVLILTVVALPQSARGAASGWQTLSAGIEYSSFRVAGPNNVFVTRMERNNPKVTLDTSVATGTLSEGRETVRGMASRYDNTINYWDSIWGSRSRVVAAINGYYFDPDTGTPWRGQVQSGWYIKRFDNLQDGSGFAWTMDRQAFIGECVNHITTKQMITYKGTGVTQPFNGINIARPSDSLVLYTPQYNSNTLTGNNGVEAVVRMSQPGLLMPTPRMITGTIEIIRQNQGSTPIAFDEVVLSATGTAATKLVTNARKEAQIGISQEMTNYQASNCNTKITSFDWTKSYASLGGDFYFLKNGVFQPDSNPQATGRLPRTSIAFNDTYIFFIVVDGRNPGVSVGMSTHELANFAKDYLGATYGITEDSGGSSTMVVNGRVMNNTTCNFQDCSKAPVPAVEPTPYSSDNQPLPDTSNLVSVNPDAGTLEAMVGNGVLMVAVQPRIQFQTHVANEKITMLYSTNVRLGPGNNYASAGSVSAGRGGVVLAHPLNGVLATGQVWWKIDFGSITGWIPEGVHWPYNLSLPFIFH
jgi:hypothetical protein